MKPFQGVNEKIFYTGAVNVMVTAGSHDLNLQKHQSRLMSTKKRKHQIELSKEN